MPLSCPGCREALPDGARFCGACGATIPVPEGAKRVCPLCRAELPDVARFCGECGQPLDPPAADGGAGPSFEAPPSIGTGPSLEPGMVAVPLLRHAPRLEMPVAASEPVEVDVEIDLDEADAHFQLVEVDAIGRTDPEAALGRLLEVYGLAPGDPRLCERLVTLGRAVAERLVGRAAAEGLDVATIRSEMKRLLRLAPEGPYRDQVRAIVGPVAVREDVDRVRGLLADGHLHAAKAVVESILSVAPRVDALRLVAQDVIRQVVSRADRLEREGDAALRRGDRATARSRFAEAIELLEDDRRLLDRMRRTG